jgi:hypothetical protein
VQLVTAARNSGARERRRERCVIFAARLTRASESEASRERSIPSGRERSNHARGDSLAVGSVRQTAGRGSVRQNLEVPSPEMPRAE